MSMPLLATALLATSFCLAQCFTTIRYRDFDYRP
jgi:hypothetical protein